MTLTKFARRANLVNVTETQPSADAEGRNACTRRIYLPFGRTFIARRQRSSATRHQTASTTPNGQAPWRNP